MAQKESAMASLFEGSMELLAGHFSSAENPQLSKFVSALTLVGIYCVTRRLLSHSKSLAKYCVLASKQVTSDSIVERYGGPPAWAMVLNSADQLGSAYAHQLAQHGYDVILCGPPVDQDRLNGQAAIIRVRHKVRTFVLILDYNRLPASSDQAIASHQEIETALSQHEVCFLVNNQTYSVPFDHSSPHLIFQSIEAVLAQINKHINCSLLIQQLILPKMLARHKHNKAHRSAILTLKTHANDIIEEGISSAQLQFPVLRSAMAFNQALTRALHEEYNGQGIDIMQVLAPYVAFESFMTHGVVLEVVMHEQMLSLHVRSVFNHLRQGYAETHGSFFEAVNAQFGTHSPFRLLFFGQGSTLQARLFQRYAYMVNERRQLEVDNIEQLKTCTDIESLDVSTATAQDLDDQHKITEMCNQEAQTSIVLETFRDITASANLTEEEKQPVEDSEGQWVSWDNESAFCYDIYEDAYEPEPQEGDALEHYSPRKIYAAELSKNMKLEMDANKQTTDILLQQRILGRTLTQSQLDGFDELEEMYEEDEFIPEPVEDVSLSVYNERKIYKAELSKNTKLELQATKQGQERLMEQKIKNSAYIQKQLDEEKRKIAEEAERKRLEEDQRLAKIEADRQAEIKRIAEEKRQAEEAERQRIEAARLEQVKQAEEAARIKAEQIRKAQEAEAEKKRKAEEEAEAERLRVEAEEKRIAEEKAAEVERLRIEAEKKRKAEEEAEAERLRVEAEQKKIAEEKAAEAEKIRLEKEAEEKRLAEEEAEAERLRIEAEKKRKAEEEAEAERLRVEAQEAEEKRIADEKAAEVERLRIEAEAKVKAEEEEAEKLRIEAEEKKQAEEAEAERLRIEAEEKKIAEEKAEAERLQKEQEEKKAKELAEKMAELERLAEIGKKEEEKKKAEAEAEAERLRIEAEEKVKAEEAEAERLRIEEEERKAKELADKMAELERLAEIGKKEEEKKKAQEEEERKQAEEQAKQLKKVCSPRQERHSSADPSQRLRDASEEKKPNGHTIKSDQPSNGASEDTNDTNRKYPNPRPYNRLSTDREKRSREPSEASEEQKETPEKAGNNPFTAKLSPIGNDSTDENRQSRQGAETPAFRDKNGPIEIPDGSSSNKKAQNSSSDRSTSPFTRVPMQVVPIRGSPNKSNLSAEDPENVKVEEWKSTDFKTINIISKKSRDKSKDKIVPELNLTDTANGIQFDTKTLSGSRESVGRVQETANFPDEEDKEVMFHIKDEGDVSDDDVNAQAYGTPPIPVSSTPEKNNPPKLGTKTLTTNYSSAMLTPKGTDTESLIESSEPVENPPLSSREQHLQEPLVTPRNEDNYSSNADMRELKMALGGGKSERSGNVQLSKSLLDKDGGAMFSDDGSKDDLNNGSDQLSFNSDIWNQEQVQKKASMQIMRSTTLKMSLGDETDQAINKVLQNLVNNFLTNLGLDNDANLTKQQKLEKRNDQLIYELATCLPFVKLAPNKYLVGTEIRSIQIKGRGVLVRTGGGYMYLSEYLTHYAKSEGLKLGLMMLKLRQNYQKVVIGLLKKQRDSDKVQKDFLKRCPEGINNQFNELVQEVRDVEEQLKKKRQRKSLKANRQAKINKNDSIALNSSMMSGGSGKRTPLYIQHLNDKPKLVKTLGSTRDRSPFGSNGSSMSNSFLGFSGSSSPDVKRTKGSPMKMSKKNMLSQTQNHSLQTMLALNKEGRSSVGASSQMLETDPTPATNRSTNNLQSIAESQAKQSLFTPIRSKMLNQTGKKGSASPTKKKKKSTTPVKK